MSKSALLTKSRELHKDIAEECNTTMDIVDDVISNTWFGVAKFMAEDKENAIYLRHLGTFYGSKEVAYKIEQNKLNSKKEDE